MTNTTSPVDLGESAIIHSSPVGVGDANDSVGGSPSLSFASLPSSGATFITCTSSRSSTNSQHRHALLPAALRRFSPLGQPENIDEGMDHIGGCQLQTRRHRSLSGMRLLDRNMFEQAPTSSPKPQPRSINQSNSPVRSASKSWRSSSDRRPTSLDGFSPTMSMTKEEFEALPPTIQRKNVTPLDGVGIRYTDTSTNGSADEVVFFESPSQNVLGKHGSLKDQ
ncbi:hypothetical protein EsDP_00004937 [Epichloe bromicola]|uniref:Uncharacterized protein n=1 Tax=Epichloe bromicola TaxID=79588 RepID=A0ABQ0CTM2_9HYPO